MPIFRKKRTELIQEKKQDLEYLFQTFSTEMVDIEKQLEDVCYQINFFGSTPELEQQKQDCEMMITWIQSEFDEIKKMLFQLKTEAII